MLERTMTNVIDEFSQNFRVLFLAENPPPVLIDEVQYAPEIFPYIKMYVDAHKHEKGAFWLTGSQKFSSIVYRT